jgi:hypothetical protein
MRKHAAKHSDWRKVKTHAFKFEMGSRVKRKKASRTRPAASGDSRTRNDRLIASAVCILLAGIVWIAFGQTLHRDGL